MKCNYWLKIQKGSKSYQFPVSEAELLRYDYPPEKGAERLVAIKHGPTAKLTKMIKG